MNIARSKIRRSLGLSLMTALAVASQAPASVVPTYVYVAPHATSGVGAVTPGNAPTFTSDQYTLEAAGLAYSITSTDGNPVTSDWSLTKSSVAALNVTTAGLYSLTLTGTTDVTVPAGGTATFEMRAFTNDPTKPEIDIVDNVLASGPLQWSQTAFLTLQPGTYAFGEESIVTFSGAGTPGSTISFASDYTVSVSPTLVTPEPTTLVLAASAVPALAIVLRRRRRATA